VYEGHDGGIHGYLSYLLSTGDGERRLEMSVTLGAVNLTDPQAAERFLTAFGTLLATAACGSPQPAADIALLDNTFPIS
jgi:D-alanyl-D-alanine carboxypeptidase